MHTRSTLKHWVEAHHVDTSLRQMVHDQRFWAGVVVAVIIAAFLVLLLLGDYEYSTLNPSHPYLDTYMM